MASGYHIAQCSLRAKQVFISPYWQEMGKILGPLSSFKSDSGSELSTRGYEGEWGLGGLSKTQENLCVFIEGS